MASFQRYLPGNFSESKEKRKVEKDHASTILKNLPNTRINAPIAKHNVATIVFPIL